MAWTYYQTDHALYHDDLLISDFCYSGYQDGKNNPAMQDKQGVGPCPQGTYSIGFPQYVKVAGPHGPYVLPLTPDPANQMFGRSGFLIHGDSIDHPGFASFGCIIVPRNIREKIAISGDNVLWVKAIK